MFLQLYYVELYCGQAVEKNNNNKQNNSNVWSSRNYFAEFHRARLDPPWRAGSGPQALGLTPLLYYKPNQSPFIKKATQPVYTSKENSTSTAGIYYEMISQTEPRHAEVTLLAKSGVSSS